MYTAKRLIILSSILLFTGAGCLGIGGNNEAATSGPAGMFLSTDRGDTWRQISAYPTAQEIKSIGAVSVYRIFEDPKDARAMYLATRAHGLFFSYDDGASWQRAAAPLDGGFVYSVAIHPQENCTIYAPLGERLYKSTDCSRTWEEVYRESRSGINIVSVTFDRYAPERVLIAQSNGDVLQTFDEGSSWSVVSRFGARLVDLISDPLQPNVFYLTTRNQGMFRSDNAAQSFVPIRDQLSQFSSGLEFRRLYLHPTNPGEIYWISTFGVLKSIDSGNSWEVLPLITPPGSVAIYAFGINPQNHDHIYYTATPQGSVRTTFYRTDDGGATWTTKRLPTGQIPTALRIHKDQGDWLFLGFTVPQTN